MIAALDPEGADLRKQPLIERRKQLAKLLKKPPDNIRFSAELQGDKDKVLQVARQFDLEGLTTKKPESTYQSHKVWTSSQRTCKQITIGRTLLQLWRNLTESPQ